LALAGKRLVTRLNGGCQGKLQRAAIGFRI
jgi:hypothetical protein